MLGFWRQSRKVGMSSKWMLTTLKSVLEDRDSGRLETWALNGCLKAATKVPVVGDGCSKSRSYSNSASGGRVTLKTNYR